MMKACRMCRLISEKSQKCPLCGSEDLTADYGGLIIMMDPENSDIAKRLNIKTPGKYATNIK